MEGGRQIGGGGGGGLGRGGGSAANTWRQAWALEPNTMWRHDTDAGNDAAHQEAYVASKRAAALAGADAAGFVMRFACESSKILLPLLYMSQLVRAVPYVTAGV